MKNIRLLLPIVFLIAACSGPETEKTAGDPAPLDPAVQAVIDASTSVGDPRPIHAVREQLGAGEAVILQGRIMGVMSPFVENRAVFVLGNNDILTACSDTPGDTCPTPWDACCDPGEIKRAGTATIQIVDVDGRVVHQGLEGVNGLTKLATVRVAGTLAPGSGPESLVINATAIDVL